MNVLAISTSTQAGSVAVFKDAKLVNFQLWMRSKSHGEIITPAINSILKDSAISLKELDLIAVDRGPGSFTGIRVAVNTAKALSYSSGVPIWAEDSLSILSGQAPLSYGKLLCCLNAFKNEVFIASFEAGKNKWKSKLKPRSVSIEKLNSLLKTKHLVLGDGLESYQNQLTKTSISKIRTEKCFQVYPDAKLLGQRCLLNYKESNTLDWESLTSLYIKASAAEEKLKKGLLKPVPKF